jgi:predicted transcriptional regulator
MGTQPQLAVRIVANMEELRAGLKTAQDQITAVGPSVAKLSSDWAKHGQDIIIKANVITAAVERLGGASTLTGRDAATALRTMDAAIDQLHRTSKPVPELYEKTAASLRSVTSESQKSTMSMLSGIPVVGQFIAAMSVERLLSFAWGAVQSAARLDDLRLATGLSADALQRFVYVGSEVGVDIETMARGVEQLSAKLANGDKNAVDAVSSLGLSVKDLIASGPEEAFLTIAESVGRIEDPMTKGGVAADLFGGKLAKTLLPMLGELRQKMADVPQRAIISDENIKKADEFEDSLKHLWTSTEALIFKFGELATWVTKATIPVFTKSVDEQTKAQEANTKATQDNAKAKESSISNADLLANALSALRSQAVEPLTQSQKDAVVELLSYGKSQTEVAKLVQASEASVKLFVDAQKAATEEAKKLATEQAKAAEEVRRITERSVLETTKLWEDFYATKIARGGTSTEIEIARIERWRNVEIAKLRESDANYQQHYDAINALADQSLEGMLVNWRALGEGSKEYLDDIAARAWATYDAALNSSKTYSRESIQGFRDLAMAAQDQARNWRDSHNEAADSIIAKEREVKAAQEAVTKAAKDKAEAMAMGSTFEYDLSTNYGRKQVEAMNPGISRFLEQGYSLAQAMTLLQGSRYHFATDVGDPDGNEWYDKTGKLIAAAANGMTNGPGGWTLVGEKGPELLNLPTGANVIPNNQIGSVGSSITISAGAFVFQNPIMNDRASMLVLGNIVKEALVLVSTSSGQRLS